MRPCSDPTLMSELVGDGGMLRWAYLEQRGVLRIHLAFLAWRHVGVGEIVWCSGSAGCRAGGLVLGERS